MKKFKVSMENKWKFLPKIAEASLLAQTATGALMGG